MKKFNYGQFKQELQVNKEKKKLLKKYYQLFADNQTIKDEPFYCNYLTKFKAIKYEVTEAYSDLFDYDLLLSLVAGSFSSEYDIVFEPGDILPKLLISVRQLNIVVNKSVSELHSDQITRLFEIYLEENINMSCCREEVEEDRIAIDQERIKRISLYNSKIKRISPTPSLFILTPMTRNLYYLSKN